MRYVVIMAGGAGTRLWPLSRQGTPKQLLKLVDGKSLLRLAVDRALGLVPPERILICTGAGYLGAVAADLPDIPADNLLGEPVGRDSLNAVVWPAAVLHRRDPDAVIAQMTADQIMEPVSALHAALAEAFEVAESDRRALVTLGVVPTSPHTGYGYLHRGAPVPGFPATCEVVEFKEKPSLELATGYLESGEYWWNSGMFVWRADTLLEQVHRLLPDTYRALTELAAHPEKLHEIYPGLFKTSVDFGIMEPVSKGATDAHVVAVALPIEWRDVGGFASLAEILSLDSDGNAHEGLFVGLDSRGNVIINTAGEGHLVATVGVSGMVVVQTPEITMVTPLEQADRIKELVAWVGQQAGVAYC